MGGFEERIVVENMEGGSVNGLGLGFAPGPEGSEDGHSSLREVGVTGDPPQGVWVAFANDGGVPDESIARLLEPFGSAEFGELLFEEIG